MLQRVLTTRFVCFCYAGVLGLLVDVLVLSLVRAVLGLYLGRLVSFLAAVTTTWIVNRNLAFHDRQRRSLGGEWLRYLSANSAGAVVNYTTYAILITEIALCARYPALAIAAGSVAGLLFNFTASHVFVFTKKS